MYASRLVGTKTAASSGNLVDVMSRYVTYVAVVTAVA